MRQEWLEDLLAVLDHGSLARAAERRFVTQSAFTRRIQAIEASLGIDLFDRSKKPLELLPSIRLLEGDMRELYQRMRKLRLDMQHMADGSPGSITFSCQHAITASISPEVVKLLSVNKFTSVRVLSGDRDECLMTLLAGETDFVILYEISGMNTVLSNRAFETIKLGSDELVPVCSPSFVDSLETNKLPIIAYPDETFLGEVFMRDIRPRIPGEVSLVNQAETSLTLAALQYAAAGIGIAWLPQSLVQYQLRAGELKSLSARLPTQPLDIRGIRLTDHNRVESDRIWSLLKDHRFPSYSNSLSH